MANHGHRRGQVPIRCQCVQQLVRGKAFAAHVLRGAEFEASRDRHSPPRQLFTGGPQFDAPVDA